jgi:hypothetical protein
MEEKALLVITLKEGELLAKLKSNYNKQIMQYNKLIATNKRIATPFQLRARILYKQIAQIQQQ